MPDTTRNRMVSVKYPCGECKNECKDACLSCTNCGTWYHAGNCSGVPSNILTNIKNISGLIWLCVSCEIQGEKKVRSDWTSDSAVESKVDEIERKIAANSDSLTKMSDAINEQMEIKLESMRSCFEKKLDEILVKQKEIPGELEASWSEQPNTKPNNLKLIMKETLEQQEKEKLENKREANLVLFRVPKSKKTISKERQEDDLAFSSEF